MPKEFQIAILCAVASLPAGLAMSLAIEYFPFFKAYPGLAFWGSLLVTILLLVAAALIAIKGERAAEREGAKERMIPLIGMIVFGIGFVACTAWYFGPIASTIEAPKNVDNATIINASATIYLTARDSSYIL
jgi:hypothetical protein